MVTTTHLDAPIGTISRGRSKNLFRVAARAGSVSVQLLYEARPPVQLVFLLRLVVGTGMCRASDVRAWIGILGWMPLIVAIYVYNGVTDRAGDEINGSSRPLAKGLLSARTAAHACWALSALGLGLCWTVSPTLGVLAIAMLVVGWAYSSGPSFKNKPAGFAVVIALGAELTYLAGSVAAGRVDARSLTVTALLSLWIGTCCAAKDFSDLDGDRRAGRRTWPVIFGAASAAMLLASLAIATSLAAVALVEASGWPWAPAATLAAGSVALAASALRNADADSRSRRRRPYRIFMSTQYLTNAAILLGPSL